jgi:UMF1 family MFS transporter
MYGAITWATQGDQRTAIFATTALFVAGLLCLIPLDMARGRHAAQAAAND